MNPRSHPLTALCAIASLAILPGCASIISGSKQNVRINSRPPGATVEIDGSPAGRTPMAANLERKTSHRVVISLRGYKPYEVTLEQKFNGWVLGNILIGGLIGIIIDSSTGATYYLTPGEIDAALQTGRLGVVERRDSVLVAVVLRPDRGWRKLGQLTKS